MPSTASLPSSRDEARTAPAALPHPRPQLQREQWFPLDGPWEFALDADGSLHVDQVTFDREILVPFAPETPASGIAAAGLYAACWYRRTFEAPALVDGGRLLLHFGAVDYEATVWVNGQLAGRHVGGHTPFCFDITTLLTPAGPQTIVVHAFDDPRDLAKPRGKQDWKPEPHSIWYPRTTGIWQTVWLEVVPRTWISSIRWAANLERWELDFDARLKGERRDGLRLRVWLKVGDETIAEDTYLVVAGEVHRTIALSDPGVDDSRNDLLWSPASPTIIDVVLELWAERGQLLDSVRSYTALRVVSTQGDRFLLNGRPHHLRLVLDQGYWPGTGMTPPDDDALRRDVELAKAMGFNGVRKHQKIEVPRYLYWADRLGLFVWEEMPSAYRFTGDSVNRLTREWMEVIERDSSHPCIVAWVPFNESWGVPNLPEAASQRHYVRSLYHLTKTLDPTRPVIGNDGWESVATDMVGIHDYDDQPERIARRYHTGTDLPRLFRRERPGGRMIVLEKEPRVDRPIILSEFGGIALSADEAATWGYSRCADSQSLGERYKALLEVVRGLDLLAGFCYTQFADTYQEANGLLYADRTPKFPLDEMALATSGSRPTPPRTPLEPGVGMRTVTGPSDTQETAGTGGTEQCTSAS